MLTCVRPPAVDHHGSGVRGVAGLDSPEEGQDRGGVLGNTVVRPRHELELPNLSLFTGAVLQLGEQHVVTLVMGSSGLENTL